MRTQQWQSRHSPSVLLLRSTSRIVTERLEAGRSNGEFTKESTAQRLQQGHSQPQRSHSMRKTLSLLAIISCMLPTLASAQSSDRDGAYGFAGIGSYAVTIPASSNVAPEYRDTRWKNSKLGFHAGAGYRINDHFALELAAQAQGGGSKARTPTQAGDTHVRSRGRALTFSGLGVLPLGDRFEIFGRAAIGAMRTSLTATTVEFDHKATSGTLALQYGLGASMRLGERGFVRTEWNVLRPTGKSRSAAPLAGERVYASQVNVAFGRHF
ncbi:porin family protein [Stenotrophomonas sp. C4297]|uniref:porin family protein n=1 Tax=Stenotrophomonas sp. C4297 TaxID=3077847 RepID=UPI00293D0EB3|nr:porin family protein [Stenotrophomonas sp. C4297]MDV3510478.1 porin family protein [Stenotrophomonas sp. C4297]